jgi:hypothetical protein
VAALDSCSQFVHRTAFTTLDKLELVEELMWKIITKRNRRLIKLAITSNSVDAADVIGASKSEVGYLELKTNRINKEEFDDEEHQKIRDLTRLIK